MKATGIVVVEPDGHLTYPVQSVYGNRLKGPPHHGILLQHLVKIVHRERVQATVGVRPHTGRPSAAGQQTDFWWGERWTRQISGCQTARVKIKAFHNTICSKDLLLKTDKKKKCGLNSLPAPACFFSFLSGRSYSLALSCFICINTSREEFIPN